MGTLRFADQDPVPVCDVRAAFDEPSGRLSLAIQIGLPAGSLYGRLDGPADLSIRACVPAGAYRCPGGQPAFASLRERDSHGGMFAGTGSGPMGPCQLTRGPGPMTLACELGVGPDVLHVTGELPPTPDPRTDPSLDWREATYRFTGDYAADGVVEFVWGKGRPVMMQLIPLADGGLVSIAPGGNRDGNVAWLTLAGRGDSSTHWLPEAQTPSLGACDVAIDDRTRSGTLECSGDPASPSGSSTLELSWRPAP